jgi:hypothetical protein
VGPSGKLLFNKSHENKDFLAAIQERNKKLGISRSIANVDLGLVRTRARIPPSNATQVYKKSSTVVFCPVIIPLWGLN